MDRRVGWIAGAVGVVVLAIVGFFIWLFSVNGLWPVVLDITIIVTCIVSLLLMGFLGMAIFYLAVTLLRVKRELTPVLESLRDTTQAVSDTARVASGLGVAPTVRTASVLVGAAETAALVLGRGQARTRAQRRQQRRQEVERELQARGEFNGHRG
ncbi:MAG TPA: hypothetical protein VIG30_06420 [Ktedonobacterales bacterium]|jgi:hypothetical protein